MHDCIECTRRACVPNERGAYPLCDECIDVVMDAMQIPSAADDVWYLCHACDSAVFHSLAEQMNCCPDGGALTTL